MNATWSDLHNDIRTATKAEDVLALLHSADDYDEDTRWRVLSSGLDRLWDLEYSEFEDVLLEECAKRSGYEGHRVHTLLQRWLKEYPGQRKDAICWLLAELDNQDTTRVQNVLWTLIFIGYRDEAVEHKLLTLVNTPPDEKTGQVALWGLTWLGYTNRTFIEEQILKSVEQLNNVSERIMQCGRHLASQKLFPCFRDYLLRTKWSLEDERNFVTIQHEISWNPSVSRLV